MTSRSKKRRRKILKIAGYTAAAIGTAYLGKKLLGGLLKKGDSSDQGSDFPNQGDTGDSGGFSDTSEAGVSQAGFGGIPTPLLLGGAALVLFLLYKR